jgi:hypothetical protein
LAVGTTEGGEVRVYTIKESNDASKWSSVCIEASNDAQCRHCVNVQFSFGGKLLAATWGNSTVSVFDVQTSAKVAHYGGEGKIANWAGFVLAFSPDDSLLVAGGMKEPAVIHQLAPIQPTRRYAIAGKLLSKKVSFAAMSTEHVALVHESLVVVQSCETGIEICRIEAEGTVKACAGNQPVAVCATHVAFVSMQDRSVALHELPPGRRVVRHEMSDMVQGIVFSADGSKLLVGDFNTGAHVFETATGKPIECVRATDAKSVEDANFVRLEGADKELMAVGSSASSLQLIDIQNDEIVLELGDDSIPGKYASWCCTDDAGCRIGFYTTLSGSSEVVCVSVKDHKREELMRVPAICDSLTRGFAPGTDSSLPSLLLCAPFKQDLASWTGSRLSVLDVKTQQETDWSPLLPLVFGVGFIPHSSVGWAPSLITDDTNAAPAHIIHAAVDSSSHHPRCGESELIFIDTDHFQTAVADGAMTPLQLFNLLTNSPQQVALVERLPHCLNIRDKETGDTLLHLFTHEGNAEAIRLVLSGNGVYMPIENVEGDTALDLAIKLSEREIAKELWSHLTPTLNEKTALYMTKTLALLASNRSTSMLVQPYLRDTAEVLTRELSSFRTTFNKTAACIGDYRGPRASSTQGSWTLCRHRKIGDVTVGDDNGDGMGDAVTEDQLSVLSVKELRQRCARAGIARDAIEEARDADESPKFALIQLLLVHADRAVWAKMLPKHDDNNVTLLSSCAVLLPGLLDDPHHCDIEISLPTAHRRAFHDIVENCDASVFGIEVRNSPIPHTYSPLLCTAQLILSSAQVIKLTVDFKWNNNIRKIVLVHFACYSISLLLATTAMVASTQSMGALYGTPADQSAAAWIDGFQIAVAVCEVIALGNEVLQMFRQGKQYLVDGGSWNLVDICSSSFLLVAVVAHFSDDLATVRSSFAVPASRCRFDAESDHCHHGR